MSVGEKTEVTSVEVKVKFIIYNVWQPYSQGEMERGEVEKVIKKFKEGKTSSIGGLTRKNWTLEEL